MQQSNEMLTNSDAAQRQQALDISQSFIVQAPAGSGKTELLIQRYLALLPTVKTPEAIIAITFTRKAALEMRERVISALHIAQSASPASSLLPETFKLAQKALHHAQQQQWNLLDNPNALRIQTIDSLCSYLVNAAPILSQFGAKPTITDDPEALYRQAAYQVLEKLEENTHWNEALTNVLLHIDNHFERFIKLSCQLLACRDQWLPHIMLARYQQLQHASSLRQQLEQNLQEVITDSLTHCAKCFPPALFNQLLPLMQFAARNIINHQSKEAPIFKPLLELTALPAPTTHCLAQWRAIAHLLLTKDERMPSWRQSIDIRSGFPSRNAAINEEEKAFFADMKQQMQALLSQCQQYPELLKALHTVTHLPPLHYSEQQWDIITALLELLPILVAHLKVIFQQYGVIDYAEQAQGAINALQDQQQPTELALNLDYRIQHILVDEFQDTSITQYRLLEQLTSGWQANDSRTVFLVGDPMQSIYRFRQAKVGLFLQTANKGFKQLPMTFLRLTTNFRSQQALVSAYNQLFQQIFPSIEDISTGAVTFQPAQGVHNTQQDCLHFHPLIDATPEQEAAHIIQLIQQNQQQAPDNTIAVLVRARSHLTAIAQALVQAKIDFHATETTTLAEQTITQDLLALTRALTNFNDRTAWLAILRAPWCGLTLTDLYYLIGEDFVTPIWALLQRSEQQQKLSTDGQKRLAHFVKIIRETLTQQHRINRRQWIKNTWLALHGAACITSEQELNFAEQFFKILAGFEQDVILDSERLTDKLKKTYIQYTTHSAANVHLMTIHKAKGLEFDCVIMPGLHNITARDNHPLFIWTEQPTNQQNNALLLAPIKPAQDRKDPVYQFLLKHHQQQDINESLRLLYVGMTRAKFDCHIMIILATDKEEKIQPPPKNSMLALLWPYLENNITDLTSQAASEPEHHSDKLHNVLTRLPSVYFAKIFNQMN